MHVTLYKLTEAGGVVNGPKFIIIIIIIIITRKTFDSFTTKDSYPWNITHNTESTAV
jgi:hypothetical protein